MPARLTTATRCAAAAPTLALAWATCGRGTLEPCVPDTDVAADGAVARLGTGTLTVQLATVRDARS